LNHEGRKGQEGKRRELERDFAVAKLIFLIWVCSWLINVNKKIRKIIGLSYNY
jgi:hypothetical protein